MANQAWNRARVLTSSRLSRNYVKNVTKWFHTQGQKSSATIVLYTIMTLKRELNETMLLGSSWLVIVLGTYTPCYMIHTQRGNYVTNVPVGRNALAGPKRS